MTRAASAESSSENLTSRETASVHGWKKSCDHDQQRNIDSSDKSTSSYDTFLVGDDDDDMEMYGWFGDQKIFDQDTSEINKEVRKAWINVVNTKAVPSSPRKDIKHSDIIYTWINPNPSVSLKLSSTELVSPAMNISSCVNGFRIAQLQSGECRAEFQLVFCYGSVSYSCWKSLSEFRELADIIVHIHEESFPIFNRSVANWKRIEQKTRWFRCLEVKYLMTQSVLLGHFVESLLLESPSPGLMVCFVQRSNFAV
jgi:hypothetical protein